MYRLFCLLLAVPMLLVGCDSSGTEMEKDDGPQLVETTFIPLDTGNKWTYEDRGGDETVYRIVGDTTVDGTDFKIMLVDRKESDFSPSRNLLRYDNEGLVWKYEDGDPRFYFRFPDDQDGNLTDDIYTIYETENVERSGLFVEEDSTATVPAGTFPNSLMYRILEEDKDTGETRGLEEFWFEPGVGVVRQRSNLPFGVREVDLVSKDL